MARFYADIQGNRGGATRMGTPGSGIGGHIRGWHIGARVTCFVDDEGKDCVHIYRTAGSSGNSSSKLIAVLREGEKEFRPWIRRAKDKRKEESNGSAQV